MKKFYISILAIVISLGINAQNVTKGAVFTAGGNYNAVGNHVYIYAFNSDNLETLIVDSILGDFSNQVISDGHYVYAHIGRGSAHPQGGDRIFKYDLFDQNFTAIDSTDELVGFKNFDVLGDKLVITRAFPATSEFVVVLDKNNLQTILYTDNAIGFECNGIAFDNNKAYIASSLPNDTGIVHVIDLGTTITNDGSYVLDTVAVGAQDIFVENGNLYLTHARINPDYSIWYAGVTTINIADSSFVSDTAGFVTGTVYNAATGFDFYNGNILADFGNPLESYEVATATKTPLFTAFPTDAKKDQNNARILTTSTDYFSFGEMIMYDDQGTVLFSQATKVSCTALNMVTNNYPTAVNDNFYGGSLTDMDPFYFDPLISDFDIDGDSITLDSLLNQAIYGSVAIVNGEIEYTPTNAHIFDTIYYVISDSWGDTDTASVVYNLIGSVKDLELKFTSVYPNPVNDILNIRTENGAIEAIQILDLTGRVVKTSIHVSNQATIDVSDFKSGIYLVQVTVNGKVEIHRLIVQ